MLLVAKLLTESKFPIDLVCSKILCVGRNYKEHASELSNPIPKSPLIFIKPNNSLVNIEDELQIPFHLGEIHYEVELALLFKEDISSGEEITEELLRQRIYGVAIALDLTRRGLQAELKEKGHPWEMAKAFDHSCPIGPFICQSKMTKFEAIDFELTINGKSVQLGNSSEMIFSLTEIVKEITSAISINAGDVLLTGTPKGVGALHRGDRLELRLQDYYTLETTLI